MEEFFQRIKYKGELDDISLIVCRDFNLGNLITSKLVIAGYEDFNFVLVTTHGRYFVKVFSSFRTKDDCVRYIDVMMKVVEAGVLSPKLLKSEQGYFYISKINNTELRLCVMEYIDGESYFFLKQKPSLDEIRVLAHQAALINTLDIKPKYIYDHWSVTNFLEEFQKKGKYLPPEDRKMIKPLVASFEDIKINELPHCFVHGDIVATNVMKDKNGKPWIIDFGVSNYYPRIQELAVLASNIAFDDTSRTKSEEKLRIILEEYQKTVSLTQREMEVLPSYAQLVHAQYVLLAMYEKVVENNKSEENEYWLRQGRTGLLQR